MTHGPAEGGRTHPSPPSDPSGTGGGLRVSGVVHEVLGGVYQVALADGRWVEASLRGRVKRDARSGDRVVIGDRVEISESDGSWTVDSVEDRTTRVVRRAPGGRKPKVVAANLDRLFAVVAARDPDIRPELIDRLLAVAATGGLAATLVVNKVDLDGAADVAEELRAVYEPIGYPVLPVSAETGEGVAAFAAAVCSGSSALVGPSGAGKSTLLNQVDPDLELRTGGLSRKTGRGRHTTVSSRLIPLTCGGLVADTPGFSEVALWGVEPDDLAACFPEIAALDGGCRFRGCAHETEPDCAVLEAVADGRIAASRHESFRKLRAEAEEAARRW